jgi:hypothetical protein
MVRRVTLDDLSNEISILKQTLANKDIKDEETQTRLAKMDLESVASKLDLTNVKHDLAKMDHKLNTYGTLSGTLLIMNVASQILAVGNGDQPQRQKSKASNPHLRAPGKGFSSSAVKDYSAVFSAIQSISPDLSSLDEAKADSIMNMRNRKVQSTSFQEFLDLVGSALDLGRLDTSLSTRHPVEWAIIVNYDAILFTACKLDLKENIYLEWTDNVKFDRKDYIFPK